MTEIRPKESPASKLHAALELCDLGVAMMRQTLRRKLPQASESEIAERLAAWRRHRPGAEHGDGVGRPVSWPRPR